MNAWDYLKDLYTGHVENYVTVEQMAELNKVDKGTMSVLLILGGELCEEDEKHGTDRD